MIMTLKKVNLFQRAPFTVNIDPRDSIHKLKVPVSLSENGYYTLDPGTYEVIINEDTAGELNPPESFIMNGITFGNKMYSTDDGYGTLMFVHSGFLRIKPGVILSVLDDSGKRKPGRPPWKHKEKRI